MAGKGCGTCRDRRILCDRTQPTCSQCSRSKRTCQGYGLRLSWPKKNDGKRAVVGKTPLPSNRPRNYDLSDYRLINVTSFDMDLYFHLAASRSNAFQKCAYIPISMKWNPLELGQGQLYLIDYFQNTASRCLRTWGHDPTDIGNIILRMALCNETPSSVALLKSLLAISSMHRYGLHVQAASFKISALGALTSAMASSAHLNKDEAKQHVAAGMLLYSLEILDVTSTLSQWTWHIAGVKDVLKAASFDTTHCDSDFATLLEWAYYHDLLARFSIFHFRADTQQQNQLAGPYVDPKFCFKEPLEISPLRPPSFLILELLIEVCQTVFTRMGDPTSSQSLDDYNAHLKYLHWKIKKISIIHPCTHTSDRENSLMMELFQLATLVYLERASSSSSTNKPTFLSTPSQTQARIDRAFTIFSQLTSCERQLPIFILGSEARTDEERIVVLDLLARSEQTTVSWCTLKLMQAVWVQDDLAERELVYVEKLGAIISSCDIMTTFI